jgi:hypothetical protein
VAVGNCPVWVRGVLSGAKPPRGAVGLAAGRRRMWELILAAPPTVPGNSTNRASANSSREQRATAARQRFGARRSRWERIRRVRFCAGSRGWPGKLPIERAQFCRPAAPQHGFAPESAADLQNCRSAEPSFAALPRYSRVLRQQCAAGLRKRVEGRARLVALRAWTAVTEHPLCGDAPFAALPAQQPVGRAPLARRAVSHASGDRPIPYLLGKYSEAPTFSREQRRTRVHQHSPRTVPHPRPPTFPANSAKRPQPGGAPGGADPPARPLHVSR